MGGSPCWYRERVGRKSSSRGTDLPSGNRGGLKGMRTLNEDSTQGAEPRKKGVGVAVFHFVFVSHISTLLL